MTSRVVAITGAGGALGAALSGHFAREAGTDVVLSDVSEEPDTGGDLVGGPAPAERT